MSETKKEGRRDGDLDVEPERLSRVGDIEHVFGA